MQQTPKKVDRKSPMRSPHGCSNCRRSKVKCDEQKPTCTRCWKKDLQCSSPVQLRWESAYRDRGVAFGRSGVWGKSPPKKGQGQGQGQREPFPKETTWLPTPAIRPWSFVNSDAPFIQRLCEEEDDHAKRHLLPAFDAKVAIGEQGHELILSSPRSVDMDEWFTPTIPSSPGLFPSLDVVGNRLLFDYYINQICPRTGHGPMSQSPFASVILPYCISAPPTVLRAIQALAACHWSQYDPQYTDISLRLKSRVLVDFRKQISSNRTALVSKDPELLVIAMFLCLFDIVDHCDQQWIVHLQGAKDIIRLRKRQQLLTGVNESTPQDEISSFVELFFAFQDVMGRTACAKADLFGSSYWRQDDVKINPWMGCSPALVSILFSVMDLSRSRRDMVSDEDQMTFNIRANGLNNKLTRLTQEHCDRGQDQTIQRVAELKKLACLVFLNCALFGGRPSDPVIKSYIHKMLQEIVELLDLEPSCHVIWPLFVAAVELDPLDVDLRLRPDAPSMDGRRLIFELLEKMAKSSVSSVSRTRVVIEQVWKARDFSLSNSSEPKRPSISEANDWEQTSHFAWLDARVPGYVGIDLDNPQMAVGWPHPRSIKNVLGSIESYPKQSAVALAFDRSLRPVDTPYWPALMENGTRLDSYMSDIHSIYGGLFLGSKASLARLPRSLLILMERDLARGYYIGRGEFQLSYAHYEFCDTVRVLELFKMNPRTGLKYSRPFNLFNSPDTNFTGLGPFAAPTSRVCMADHDSLSLPNRLGYLYFHANDFILLCTMMLISFFCLSRFLKSTMGY